MRRGQERQTSSVFASAGRKLTGRLVRCTSATFLIPVTIVGDSNVLIVCVQDGGKIRSTRLQGTEHQALVQSGFSR